MKPFSSQSTYLLFSLLFVGATLCIFLLMNNYVSDMLINENWIDVPDYTATLSGKPTLNLTATFVGLGMNLVKPNNRLETLLDEIELFGGLFRSFQIIYVDGNSSDGTLSAIRRWKEASKAKSFDIVSSSQHPFSEEISYYRGVFLKLPREGRIAMDRNLALQHLAKSQATDIVAMCDMDIAGWDLETMYHTIRQTLEPPFQIAKESTSLGDTYSIISRTLSSLRGSLSSAIIPYTIPKWDVMCSKGIVAYGVYKDRYAFRGTGFANTNHHFIDNEDAYRDYNLSERKRGKYKRELLNAQTAVRSFHSGWRTNPFRRVDSCFGGLAIYRSHLFKGCEYDYRYKEPPYMIDCEHVFMHKCMAEKHGAEIYTNRAIKLWTGDSIFKKAPLKILQDFFDFFYL